MAPGVSENTLGEPLIGPTKKVLDTLNRAMGLRKQQVAYMNAVGCRAGTNALDNRDPTDYEIEKCSPRTRELLQKMEPQIVFTLGKVATAAYKKHCETQDWWQVELQHPAYILRMGGCIRYNLPWRKMQDQAKEALSWIDFDYDKAPLL